jgi:hypothetical protein
VLKRMVDEEIEVVIDNSQDQPYNQFILATIFIDRQFNLILFIPALSYYSFREYK